MSQIDIEVGIDPGVHTGIAMWDKRAKALSTVETVRIHIAMGMVADLVRAGKSIRVTFEDARQRKWLGQKGREALQGAGSIKRDSSIWEAFLTDLGVPYRALGPQAGGTKWTAVRFKQATGWAARTSEHARDAAVLVYGL